MPPPSLLKVGSRKFGTPCRRMQTACASAAHLALAMNSGFWDETPTATTDQAAAPVSDLVYVTPRFGGYGLLCHSARG